MTQEYPLPNVTDAEIAAAAENILRGRDDPYAPIALATLGNLIGKKWRTPLKMLLMGRRLSEVLGRSSHVVVDGPSDQLTASLTKSVDSPSIRFDPVVWAAFAKPIPDGQRRILKSTRPYDIDYITQNQDTPNGWIEVPTTAVPPAEMQKHARNITITESITKWCGDNNISISNLSLIDIPGISRHAPAIVATQNRTGRNGTAALIGMIEAVPEEDRRNYSLTLDLIYQLLAAR